MIRSDRIFGLVAIVGALAYGAGALQIQTSFMSDPVGSKTFPLVIAGAAGLCGLVMVLRPDPEPDWPGFGSILSIGVSVLVLIGYAYALKPLGFLIPTAIAAGILSYQISPRPIYAALAGVGLSIGLYILFRFLLGLSLVGLPKGLVG
jgi:putative tricarboxylic transport membrane protein